LLLLKAAISILLLYLSLRSVNLAVLGERLSRIDGRWVTAALLLLAVQVALGAYGGREIVRVRCETDARRGIANELHRSSIRCCHG
jgi:hypothetical protein